ncbi:CLUMA_CG008998, isoform A [Clunio marinus]|uniref:CLUMA_CG008998, isoform A n=1 Tax=Clunio marinus TaxID=568069 RepID=A0A1J1IAR7_9DIPT|nr:CLUMA_CG008998, isoform A [Clunio marinus]
MDTLSSLMEVKLDIRERRTEWLPLRSWTRCYIKIEAIKCFPCYIKITFHKTVNENDNGLVLRINIPGLEIYPVKSRTKEYAYGLYWKQNRKNCMAFLSLASKLSMEAHMRWVECQIQSLETYRREILQSSRCSRIEQSLFETDDSGIYQNMNETCKVRDVNDILGPLPKVPNGHRDSDKNWSRRVSTMSGIYEEIPEPTDRQRNNRDSVIYEVMTLNRLEQNSSPPPLPPRVRKNTDCSSLQRSYTTPESEMVKKKWSLFENVFGKSKRSELKRRERNVAPQPRELQLLKAKRNSFSSPDLSHLDVSFNNSLCANCSFDLENPANISSSNSYELENVFEDEAENSVDQVDSNISHNIKPNFELRLDKNVSAVNLVGSNCLLNHHIESTSPKSQPASSPPGYLEMRPGRGFDMKKVEELDKQLMNDVLYRLKYSFDSPITYKREFDYDILPPTSATMTMTTVEKNKNEIYQNNQENEPHYVCMTKRANEFSPKIPPRTPKIDEPTYVPMNRVPPTVIIESYQNVRNNQIESTKTNKRLSVDDKIASYYPNYDVPVKCNNITNLRNATDENSIAAKKQTQNSPKIKSPESSIQNSRKFTTPIMIPSTKMSERRVNSLKLEDNNNNNDLRSLQVNKKYATISRLNSDDLSRRHNQNLLSSPSAVVKKSGSISPTSIKRFTSLPRFKKFDFSPLRLKISNVLQRNNSGGC